MKVEQEVIETRREKENLQTVVDTLKQQNKNLQIEKDTEVESLSKQVGGSMPCPVILYKSIIFNFLRFPL